jgi:hypothetical protein
MKRCPRCKETKADGEFYRNPSGKLHTYCRPCNRDYASEKRAVDRQAHNARIAKWRRENPTRAREHVIRWQGKNRLAYEARRRAMCRDEAFNAYGGYVCACCGETEPMFLTIDHVEASTPMAASVHIAILKVQRLGRRPVTPKRSRSEAQGTSPYKRW